jgi:ubiquinone/menaquinone biosynthesis C-methylase UbiE
VTRRLAAVGIDASASQARRARGTCASGDALPFADASFDSVVSSCAIKHLPEPAAGVAEWRRVLRPGGAIAVVEIDGASTPSEVHHFASMTRVPPGLRWAYSRFVMETVVAVAPTVDELGELVGSPATKVAGLPYAFVVHHP